ncbi:MAG: DUF459 domain-containing protein [Kiritimatiellae bacterium]|nr:DUF459 domain-containing protein [Kiritimatiellia bacterium]
MIRKMAFAGLTIALSLTLVSAAQPKALSSATPPADNPTGILICGDSLMKILGIALERDLARRGYSRITIFTSIGSGLVRLDVLNWHDQLRSLIERVTPEVVVIHIGPNDNQPIKTADGAIIQQDAPEWAGEYLQRVKTCLDIMRGGGVKLVVWVGVPDMRDPKLQAHVDRISRIFRSVILDYPSAQYCDTQRILSREPGKFTMYLMDHDGRPIYVRGSDGMHLNRAGSEMLAHEVADAIEKWQCLQNDSSDHETP